MKRKFLAAFMFAAALSQIACDKSSSEKASDCMSDPICKQTVAQASAPQLFPLAQQAAATGQVPAAAMNQTFRISTVANAAIKAQSAKVAAAIKADDNNPMSDYYKAPTPNLAKATIESPPARTPASVNGSESIFNGVTASGSGEASR